MNQMKSFFVFEKGKKLEDFYKVIMCRTYGFTTKNRSFYTILCPLCKKAPCFALDVCSGRGNPDNVTEFFPEKFDAWAYSNGKELLNVKWLGQSSSQNSWEERSSLAQTYPSCCRNISCLTPRSWKILKITLGLFSSHLERERRSMDIIQLMESLFH